NIATFQDEIEDAIRNLRAGYESTSLLSKQIDNLDRTIAPIINLKEVERQKNEDFDKNKRDLIAEQNLVSRHLRTIRETIINLRDEQNDAIYTAAKRTKTLAYIAIGLPLLFILYIARRVIRINKQLRINNHVAEELNKEYKFAQEKINMTNWVLKESNILNEKLNGIDDEREIAKINFETIRHSIKFLAGAFYIKKSDTQEYILHKHVGIDNKNGHL